MPNGESRNFVRFLRSIAVFRGKFRKWPSKIRLSSSFIQELHEIMDKIDYEILQKRIKIIPDSSSCCEYVYIPEDDDGNKILSFKLDKNDEFFDQKDVLKWIGINFPDYGPQA